MHTGSSIFQTQWKPTNERTGLKYLQAPLRGPAMVKYYPPRMPKISTLNAKIPELGAIDFLEEQR
jgi:small subunit ribosomal protein S33